MTRRLSPALLGLLLVGTGVAQQPEFQKVKRDSFDTYEELRAKQRQAGIDTLTYVDSTFNFQVRIPPWLHLLESGSIYAWGGTLPAVDDIENAILIKAFEKSDFNSMDAFKKYVVEDLIFGQPAPWSSNHISWGKKDLGPYNSIGPSYKVYLLLGKLFYHCEYVLVETPTAYLWIDYTATETTFDKNLSKFDDFMHGFMTTNFKR